MSSLTRFFGNLLSIKPNEWEGVVYFFLVLVVFSFGASFARSIGMTLLIANLGGDKLPVIFILIDLSVMVGSMVYAHYTKKASGLAILAFFFITTAVFSVVAQLLLNFSSLIWVYGFFFVGFFFFYILISIHATSVVASYFTAVQMKRVSGVINTGIPIGGILGGITLVVLLKFFHFQPESLILVLGVSCLGAYGFLRAINSRLSPVRASNPEFKSTTKNPLRELLAAFRYIIGSRLMIFMAVGLMLFVVGNKFLEYQYQVMIYPEIYPDTQERASFFATYEIFANVLWLVIQLFLTSRIVVSWGVGASNLLHPVLTMLVSIGLFSYFYTHQGDLNLDLGSQFYILMLLGVSSQFVNQEMRGAFRTPVNNLLFNAIPPNLWGTNKAFLNGIIFPFATVIAGIMLILLTGDNKFDWLVSFDLAVTPEQLTYIIPLIVFVMSILGIIAALPQWFAYNEGVFGLLNRELFDRRSEAGMMKNNGNSLKQVVEQKLGSGDYYQIIAALEMIRVLRLNYFANQVGNLLLKIDRFEVKEHCINTLAALPQSNTNITYLVEALKTANDDKVLPLILRNLTQFTSVNLNNTVEKMLKHHSPQVFIEACLYLYSRQQYSRKRDIENRILAQLRNEESPDFPLYLYALGELKQAHYSENVLPFIDHERSTVRVAAFTAYIRMLEGQLDPYKARLVDALSSPDKEMKLVALRALKECQPLEDWMPIIRLLGAKDRTLVNESKELLRLSLGVCKNALVAHVFSNKVAVQERFEILSLIYNKLNEQQRQNLKHMGDLALQNFIRVRGLIKLHESMQHTSRAHELVAKVLDEVAENHLLHVITIITYASEQDLEFFQRISRGLLSPSRANQGNALEVLSNAGERYLVGRVLRYFDERLNDLAAIDRIHMSLFVEPLDVNVKNYGQNLINLDHPMLRASLHYMQAERTGKLRLPKHADTDVRDLLTKKTRSR